MEVIDMILSVHNSGTAEKLAQQAEETFKGQRLNELCDHYHEKYSSFGSSFGTVKIWPRSGFEDNDNKLSAFLKSQENSSEKIEELKASLYPPLMYTSKYQSSGGIDPILHPPKQVAFLVDYSGSMKRVSDGSTLIEQALENVLNVFEEFIAVQDSVSFTLFDHQYNEIFPMSIKSAGMFDKIKHSPPPKRGGTAFFDSMIALLDTFPAGGRNDWIIALTDGEDQHSKQTLADCMTAVKKSHVNLFLIGFMVSNKLAGVLKSITNEIRTDKIGKYITAIDKAALESAFADVATLMEGPIMLT